jgi:hypothetical protein
MDYPANFACPNWDYTQQMSNNVDRTQFEAGWTRTRKRWQQGHAGMSLQFVMPTTDYSVWSQWMTDNGYVWFDIELDRFNDTKEVVTMRLTAPWAWNYSKFDSVSIEVLGERLLAQIGALA